MCEKQICLNNGFVMRSLQYSDLNALATIWNDPEVTRFLPSRGAPISREATEKSLKSFIQHWEERNYGIWGISADTISEIIGYCGLRFLDELNEVEVLYGLAKSHWNRGIATQATKAAIAYGFNVANLDRIIAMAFPENQGSIRVMEKAGLKYEKQIHIFGLNAVYYYISSS